MDAYTLVVVSALAGTIMAATMFLLYRASPRSTCLLDWSMAGLFFVASNGMALAAMGYALPFVLVPGVGNALYVAGHFMILAGVRRHLGMAPRFDWLLALMLLVLMLHAFPFAHGSVHNRMMMLTPIVAGINGYVALLLSRQPDDAARSSYLPLILVEGIFMLQLSLRAAVLAVGDQIELTLLGNQLLQTCGSLAVLVFLSLATMCCALIVIRQQELALRRASLTDALTGWKNRRALHDIAEAEFQRSRRSTDALHFLTFDVDYFKTINDQHGHAVGDAAICHVTRVSAQALRGYDTLFRIGGEEFAVLIAGSSSFETRMIGERVRDLIEKTPLLIEGKFITLTVSIGVAACEPADQHWDDALRRADQALYQAKRLGRNRLCVWGADLAPGAVARTA